MNPPPLVNHSKNCYLIRKSHVSIKGITIEYGSILYDNCTTGSSLLVENVQRRAALVCTGAMRRTETSKLLAELNWSTWLDRPRNAKLYIFYKLKRSQAPVYFTKLDCIQDAVVSSRLRLRTQNRIRELMCRIKCFKKSYFPSVISNWNQLSQDIVSSSSISIFKPEL